MSRSPSSVPSVEVAVPMPPPPKPVYFLLAHGGVPYVSGSTNSRLPADSGCTLKFPHDTTQETVTLCSHPAFFGLVCERNRPAVRVGPGGVYHDITIGFEAIPGVPVGIYDCSGKLLYGLDRGIPGFERSCRLHDVVAYMIGKHAERMAEHGLSPEFDLWVMSCSIAVGKSTVDPTNMVFGDPLGNQVLARSGDPEKNYAAAASMLFGPHFKDLRTEHVNVKYIPAPGGPGGPGGLPGPGEPSGSGGPKGRGRRTYKKRKNGKKRRQTKRRI